MKQNEKYRKGNSELGEAVRARGQGIEQKDKRNILTDEMNGKKWGGKPAQNKLSFCKALVLIVRVLSK